VPLRSEAQRRLMHAVLGGRSTKVPKDVAGEFVKKDEGGKLPEHVKKQLGRPSVHKG